MVHFVVDRALILTADEGFPIFMSISEWILNNEFPLFISLTTVLPLYKILCKQMQM